MNANLSGHVLHNEGFSKECGIDYNTTKSRTPLSNQPEPTTQSSRELTHNYEQSPVTDLNPDRYCERPVSKT